MISLCMIVKNEEFFLDGCLMSAAGFFDEIIVVDTGSNDRTKAIAKRHGAKIFDFIWSKDFSAARNFAADQAKNDWIFYLDADETIISYDLAFTKDFVSNFDHIGCVVRKDYEGEKNGLFLIDRTPRLYNKSIFRFSGRIHEQIKPINPLYTYSIVNIPVELMHYGYSPEIISSKNKLERNSQMLLDELALCPNDPYLLYQLGKSYFAMNRDINKACEYFEKALSQNPDHKLEYVYSLVECYGYALLRAGHYNKSMEIIKYQGIYGHIPAFMFLLGHIYQNNAKLIEAVECFESCIGKCEGGIGSFISYYNIGVILECVGMADEAEAYYRRCGDYSPALSRLKVLDRRLK